MAPSSSKLVLLLLSAILASSGAADHPSKDINIVFYLQDWATGKNVTAIQVAERNASAIATDYGTVMVIDDAATEGTERNSTQVGRAQGIYVNSALDGSNFHLSFSLVFTNEKYNGSTLEIQGADRYLLNSREVSVMSGTGVFRFAKGYAVLTTFFASGLNAVVKFNVTVRLY